MRPLSRAARDGRAGRQSVFACTSLQLRRTPRLVPSVPFFTPSPRSFCRNMTRSPRAKFPVPRSTVKRTSSPRSPAGRIRSRAAAFSARTSSLAWVRMIRSDPAMSAGRGSSSRSDRLALARGFGARASCRGNDKLPAHRRFCLWRDRESPRAAKTDPTGLQSGSTSASSQGTQLCLLETCPNGSFVVGAARHCLYRCTLSKEQLRIKVVSALLLCPTGLTPSDF